MNPPLFRFDEDGLRSALSGLPAAAQSAFAQACAWRLLQSGRNTLSVPDRKLCVSALQIARSFVDVGEVNRGTQEPLLREVMGNPSVDDDGMAATAFVLGHMTAFDVQQVLWAARRAYDDADAFAQTAFDFDVSTKEIEAALLAHDAVQFELRRQSEDLDQLVRDADSASDVVDRAARPRPQSAE